MKYKVFATYSFEKYCGEIEANSEDEACELADELGMIPSEVILCHQCNREIKLRDHPYLHSDDYIYAEECEEN